MISLTFYGGAGEIGGNKILLEYGGAKVYLDFAQSFDFGEDYFLDWLKPGAANGLECYFEFDLLPKIPRLYSESSLGITLHKAHCSGHAGKSDLEYAIKTIQPDILIPIHTQNPEEFKKIHDNVMIVKRGDKTCL